MKIRSIINILKSFVDDRNSTIVIISALKDTLPYIKLNFELHAEVISSKTSFNAVLTRIQPTDSVLSLLFYFSRSVVSRCLLVVFLKHNIS